MTPDIDIHGHAAVTTGVNDQKFGFTLAGGHAAEAVKRILHQPLLELVGLHCHIGSQITDPALYGEAIRRMIAAMADIRARHGVILHELNIGGGHGIPYVTGDPELDLAELADVIDDALDWACAAERFPRPRIVIEPGRAISARAGVTLYRVVSVKSQSGGRTFVAVDGGMSDNPRVALYGAKYTVALANRHSLGPTNVVTVAGRHCESGDEIARDVELPADIHPGDLLAVAVHRRLPAQHGVELQHGGQAADRRRPAWTGRANSCAARRPRTCWRATADGQAAVSLFTTSTPVGSTPTETDAPGVNPRACELAI